MWLSILLLLPLALCLYYQRVRTHWARRGVPSVPPHCLLGNLTWLQKANPAVWMRKVYQEYRGCPYVGVWWLWKPALIINSPEIARRVLVKDSDVFRNHFLSGGKSDIIGSLNVFTVNDPLWTKIRRHMTSVFTSAKMKALQNLFTTKSNELVQRLKKEMEIKNEVNLRDIFSDYTTDIIGTASFGIRGDATLTGDSAMRRVTRQFQEYSAMRGLAWSSIFFFPYLTDFFGLKMFPKEATDFFKKIFSTVLQQRGGYDHDPKESKDILDILLKMKKEAKKEGIEMTEEVLVAQSTVMVQGGFDTTASLLTFVAYELAHSPEIQNKMYQELIAARERLGVTDLDMTTLGELAYLNCVIKEGLRKYPAMGWLDRVNTVAYKIDDDLTIPAGTPVYVNAVGMHLDPDYFPEPTKFDPDRFLAENERDIKPFVYLPFGEGPRACIGKRFAMISIRNVLANIVLNFDIRPTVPAKKPSDIEIEKRALFVMPGEKVLVQLTPRE